MQQILTYLEDHISEDHSLQSISDKFGLSDQSLSRLFQATLNISFLQYLKLLRMVKAFELILQTDHPLSDIAHLSGYQSLSSFSNTFFKLTGFRPSDFINYK